MGGALSRDHTLQGERPTPLSHRRPACYFHTSLKRRGERDDTALNSQSIIRPIYQLGSLCTINKHIPALPRSAPRGAAATSSWTIATGSRDAASITRLCLLNLICLVCRLVRRALYTLVTSNIRVANWSDWVMQQLLSREALVETRLTWPNCFAYSVKEVWWQRRRSAAVHSSLMRRRPRTPAAVWSFLFFLFLGWVRTNNSNSSLSAMWLIAATLAKCS